MRLRAIRFLATFEADLDAQVRWLAAHRSPAHVTSLRGELAMLGRLLARSPALMPERHRVGTTSFRLAPLRRLPYLVWYMHDAADPAGPVHFIQLLHEKQDRARFDAGDSF